MSKFLTLTAFGLAVILVIAITSMTARPKASPSYS